MPIPRPQRGAHVEADGSWLGPEELAYSSYSGSPSGSRRRAYARLQDGSYRIVVVGVPDTYFSIPGYVTIRGRRYWGFVGHDDDGYYFHMYKPSHRGR